ncbi:MAG: sulfite exporter TauE/SafE family protein [Rhodospirillaceae bacterium]|nr:sulfite exporter TauE/SafE family protein [Rhodospirillaceae bacterium]
MILGVSWADLGLASLAMALGGLIQASVGLGFALAAIPLIALIETAFIPGPIMLAGLATVAMIAWRGAGAIDRGEIGLGVCGLVAGTAVGAVGLWLIPPGASRPVFGALILVAVLVSLVAPRVALTRRSLLAAGTAAGVIGTMVGMHGPPLGLVYQNEDPLRARVMLSTFFIPASAISLCALALLGRFGTRELGLGLLLIPGPMLGLAAAPLVGRYLDRRRTRYAILIIAAISGALLLF